MFFHESILLFATVQGLTIECIGYFSFLSYFYVKIATTVELEPYAYSMNSLLKFGFLKTGAWVIANLIFWKASLPSLVQTKSTSFFNIRVIDLTMLEKSWINLLMKLIWPKKDCKAFLLDGRVRSFIALTLFGSIAQPSFKITWPNNLPSSTIKIDFLGFSDMPYLLHLIKAYSRCYTCRFLSCEKIVISSRYTSRLLFINSPNAWSIALWKVALVLDNPNGILWKLNVPHLVVKAILNLSLFRTQTWLYPKKSSINENLSALITVFSICSM